MKEKELESIFGEKNIRLVIWDTETTGTKNEDRIVEIGMLDVCNNRSYNKRFNPGVPMSKEASEITGINTDDLKNEVSLPETLDEIESFIREETNKIVIMLAHNSDFDERMLKKEYIKKGKMFPPKNVVFVDSLEIFRTWLSGNKYDVNEFTKRPVKGTFKLSTGEKDPDNIKNKDLYYRYSKKALDGGHNAMCDVYGLYHTLKKLFESVWGRKEYWYMNKRMLELHFISEIMDIEYINDLVKNIKIR